MYASHLHGGVGITPTVAARDGLIGQLNPWLLIMNIAYHASYIFLGASLVIIKKGMEKRNEPLSSENNPQIYLPSAVVTESEIENKTGKQRDKICRGYHTSLGKVYFRFIVKSSIPDDTTLLVDEPVITSYSISLLFLTNHLEG